MCDCKLCTELREDRAQLAKLSEESKTYFEKILDRLYMVEFDNDWLRYKLKELED